MANRSASPTSSVTTPTIPAGRYGTVLVKKEGMTHEFGATAERDVAAGRTVRVTGTAGNNLIVTDERPAAAPESPQEP